MAQDPILVGAVANDGTGDTWRGAMIKVNANDAQLFALNPNKRILVQQASDLSGVLDSTIEYMIDGVIDMGSQSIIVPQGGLSLAGFNFDVSKLISSAASYTMFTSPAGGSGNLLGKDYAVEVTGTGSKVYDLVSDTGNEAFEFARINYNNCTSLGTIDNYRQGLEVGTGRFGGSPTLILKGVWVGGYFIDTSIVRSLDSGMTTGLFQAGAGFLMSSRFRSNMNIDLPASADFFDFAPANFVNPSTVQITGAIVTRNGSFDATDSNITPNMDASDLAASFDENIGMENTFEGGVATVTSESTTTIASPDTFVDLAGTWTATELQHFDSPSNGQLRHLGNDPREYKITASLTIVGTSNDEISVECRKFDSSSTTFSQVSLQVRQINALVGSRNAAFFTVISNVTLDQNDYIILRVANTASNDVTAELDSFFLIEER